MWSSPAKNTISEYWLPYCLRSSAIFSSRIPMCTLWVRNAAAGTNKMGRKLTEGCRIQPKNSSNTAAQGAAVGYCSMGERRSLATG